MPRNKEPLQRIESDHDQSTGSQEVRQNLCSDFFKTRLGIADRARLRDQTASGVGMETGAVPLGVRCCRNAEVDAGGSAAGYF